MRRRFFQDLVQDRFMMETPEVVSWFRCQENIRKAKHILERGTRGLNGRRVLRAVQEAA